MPDNNSNHEVGISVNNKPVKVEGPKTTGLKIKEAAIAQGVQIQLDFQLAEIRPNNPHLIIGDEDPVTVHPGLEFVATAGDDNSRV